MLKQRIKTKIRNFITGLDLPHIRAMRWQLDDISAQTTLNNHYNFSSYFPQTNWSLRPSTLLHVLNDITINQRKCIVDLGCGVSTIYMAKHLKCSQINGKIYAIDESQEWLEIMRSYLHNEGLGDFVEFIHAPLKPSGFLIAKDNLWYDQDTLANFIHSKKIDLVLVDGPRGNSSPFARFGAVPYFKDALADQYAIFLDDADRKEELEIINSWQEILRVKVQKYNRYKLLTTNQEFSTEPLFQMYDRLIKS